MPLIEVPIEEDRMLEEVVPAYLKGDKKMTQRVRWAIEEFVKTREPTPGKARPESDPKLTVKK